MRLGLLGKELKNIFLIKAADHLWKQLTHEICSITLVTSTLAGERRVASRTETEKLPDKTFLGMKHNYVNYYCSRMNF